MATARKGARSPRSTGRTIVVVMVVVIGFTAMIAVQETADVASGEPVVWGTFRETECIWRGRGGCRSHGTWTSDDSSIVWDGVQLSGTPGEDRTVRAGVRLQGLRGGEEAGLVYTERWIDAGPWAAWSSVAFFAIVLAVFLRNGRRHRR